MKKTFNINVAGFPFIIDDDAYTLLSDYLDTIEKAFSRQEDGNEVASDIESRIAELLLECTASGSQIISAANVEEVISRVGTPEEMIEDDIRISVDGTTGETTATVSETERVTPPPYIPPQPPVKRKLYRDPMNAMLGGVCSGFAWYLKLDPTMVRLITVLITIFSVATGGIAYLIFWIVIPEARTPLERMEMMGEEPTVENIGKTVTGNFREDTTQSASSYSNGGFGSTIANICSILVKVLIAIGMILAVIVLGAMIIGLLGCVFALIMFGTSWGGTVFGEMSPFWEEAGNIPVYGVVCGIGSILTIGIPLFLLVRKGWKKAAPLSTSMKTTLTILWIVGFITAATSTGRLVNLSYETERQHEIEYNEKYGQWNEKETTVVESEVMTDSTDASSQEIDSISAPTIP